MGSPSDIEPDEITSIPTFRAAYSDRTALLMAKLAKRAYDRVEDPEILEALQAEFAAFGLKVCTPLIDEGKGTAGVLLESPDLIVIAFRGTENLLDIITDLRMGFHMLQGEVRVHKGFFEAYEPIRSRLFDCLVGLLQAKRRPVYITGHSLGGALALMAAAELGNHQDADIRDSIAACYTFGCPKAGDRRFDQLVKVPIYRIANGVDIVPALPPILSGYQHVGDRRYFATKGVAPLRQAPGALQLLRLNGYSLLLFFVTRKLGNISNHFIDHYIDLLTEWIRAETKAAQERRQRTADPTL